MQLAVTLRGKYYKKVIKPEEMIPSCLLTNPQRPASPRVTTMTAEATIGDVGSSWKSGSGEKNRMSCRISWTRLISNSSLVRNS